MNLRFLILLLFIAGNFGLFACKKCVRCTYDNNFDQPVQLPEYCGKKKDIQKYKDAYKDYRNFNCLEIKKK